MDIENIAMTLIAHSGDARTLAYRALNAAKAHDFEEADRLMKESEQCSILAHNGQSELLFAEANGNKTELNVLLVHAQDHLMTSMLAQELIRELIEVYKVKQDKE